MPLQINLLTLLSLKQLVLDQLTKETANLTKESVLLAQAIVKAILMVTETKFAAERRRYEAKIEERDRRIIELIEDKDDLENYGRGNTVVIAGPAMTPSQQNEDCYQTSLNLIESKVGIQLERADIDVCHRLPSNKQSGSPEGEKKPMIVKFVRRETKHKLLKACKIKKPEGIYINDSLSKTRNKIMYVVRKVKKEYNGVIASYKTEDGNIRIYSPLPENTLRNAMFTLNTRRQLDEFLMTKLGFTSTRYIEEKKWHLRRSTS